MVRIRPLCATVVRSDGQATAQPRNRPTSALLRPPHPARGASPDGSRDPVVADGSNEGAAGRQCQRNASASSKAARSRPRPETAKPRRSSAAAAAIEESKSLIRQLFDLCDAVHMDSALLESLHRNLQSYSLNDTASFQKMLESVQEYRRTTVAVLKRIETRERVVQCFEQFAEENVLNPLRHVIGADVAASALHSQRTSSSLSAADFPQQHHRQSSAGKSMQTSRSSLHSAASFPMGRREPSNRGISPVTAALQELLQSGSDALDEYVFSLGEGRLGTLAAAGDAILQSLQQCTEALEGALAEWDASTESMLDGIVDGSQPVAGSSTDGVLTSSPSGSSPIRDNSPTASPSPPRAVRLSAPPEVLEASKQFLWRGTDYKAKMRLDEHVFGQLREHWNLSHISRYSVVREHRIRKERLQADHEAMQRFHDEATSKAREEFLNAAAVRIQAAFRGHQATMWFQMVMLKKRAVRSITRWWRTLKARKCFFVAADFSKSAIVVQRVWRGYCARKRLPHLLRSQRAAVKIQRWWRYWDSHFRMMVRQVQRQHVLYASTVVLRSMRRFVALVRRRREQRLIDAVSVIQRWCRGRQAARRDWAEHMALASRYGSTHDATAVVLVPHGQDYGNFVATTNHTAPLLVVPQRDVGVQASPCEPSDQAESFLLIPPQSPGSRPTEHRPADDAVCKVPDEPSEFVSPGRSVIALVDCDRLFPTAILSEARWGRFAERGSIGQCTTASSTQPSAHESSVTTAVHVTPVERQQKTLASAVRIQCFWRCALARVRARHLREERARRSQETADRAAARLLAAERVAAAVAHQVSSRLVAAMRRVRSRFADPTIRGALRLQRWWRRIALAKREGASREQQELEAFISTNGAAAPLFTSQKLRPSTPSTTTTRGARALGSVPVAGYLSALDNVGAAVALTAHAAATVAPQLTPPPQNKGNGTAQGAARSFPEIKAVSTAAATLRPSVVTGGAETSPHRTHIVKLVDIRSQSSEAVETLRRRKQAAVCIAQWASRYLRDSKNRLSEREKAARTIARAFRSYKLQRSYFVRKRNAAEEALRRREVEEAALAAQVDALKKHAALDIWYWYQHLSCRALLRRLNANSAAILARPDRNASARKLQKFWVITREKLRTMRLRQSVDQTLAGKAQQESLVRAAVRIQSRFRAFLHRQDLAVLREQFLRDRTSAVLVIQKHVRRWLAKNTFWQEKLTRLSMFRELQRLRQKEKTRVTSTSGILRPAPKHAW